MADDIKKIIEEATDGLRKDIREVGVKVEAVQSDMKQVLEGVETHTQQLERIETRLTNLEPLKDDVEAIKVTVEGIKRDLTQKVDRDEFSALEVKLRPAV